MGQTNMNSNRQNRRDWDWMPDEGYLSAGVGP
jgi:hypothetical protein